MYKRERWAALAGAIMITIALPIAIDQGYVRDNPYLLPMIGLVAALLYIGFFVTTDFFVKLARSFYERNRMLSLMTFVIIGAFFGAVLGAAEWFTIVKSKEHILTLKKK